tara:strand:+ start:2232 stop:2618 length:387 start_codon:yes stop_codon:yes gene_type:complete
MNFENIKFLLIGTAVAFAGGLLRVLISIQNKEKKRPWEHLVTLLIVVIVGLTLSYSLSRAELHNEWYSMGILFVLGYGYDKFLKMITTNLPDWIDALMKGYLEKRYGVDMKDKNLENEDKTNKESEAL